MTTDDRIYLALSTDATLLALYGGTPNIYNTFAAQNFAVGTEFSYTVYREFPATQIDTLDVPSNNSLTVRRYAFETWSTGNATAAAATLAKKIAKRIEVVLRSIAEPTGLSAVYPEGRLPIYSKEEKAVLVSQNFYMHTALD